MAKWRCYIEKCIRNVGSRTAEAISYTIERTCWHKNTDCPKLDKFKKKAKTKDINGI